MAKKYLDYDGTSYLWTKLKAYFLAQSVVADYVVEQGTDAEGWHYRKWNSGAYDAERTRNIGQYTINTTVNSPIRVGGDITSALPSAAISGDLEIALVGNSTNSPCFLEKVGPLKWHIAKVTTQTITMQNLTVSERTIGAKWK